MNMEKDSQPEVVTPEKIMEEILSHNSGYNTARIMDVTPTIAEHGTLEQILACKEFVEERRNRSSPYTSEGQWFGLAMSLKTLNDAIQDRQTEESTEV